MFVIFFYGSSTFESSRRMISNLLEKNLSTCFIPHSKSILKDRWCLLCISNFVRNVLWKSYDILLIIFSAWFHMKIHINFTWHEWQWEIPYEWAIRAVVSSRVEVEVEVELGSTQAFRPLGDPLLVYIQSHLDTCTWYMHTKHILRFYLAMIYVVDFPVIPGAGIRDMAYSFFFFFFSATINDLMVSYLST